MNKIEIEIPNNKEIDWAESAKQERIVFKDKQPTYKDICKELFNEGYYFTDSDGSIRRINCGNPISNLCLNNASTRHQLECILAKNQLANVARYLNSEWEWELGFNNAFFIMDTSYKEDMIDLKVQSYSCYPERMNILFKSEEAAYQAIKILGEETVKLALTPLY